MYCNDLKNVISTIMKVSIHRKQYTYEQKLPRN